MRVLITGISGLVGSAIARNLLKAGHLVRAIVRENSKLDSLSDISSQIEFLECDILDVLSLENALKDIEWVIHTAAIVSFIPKERKSMYQTNVEGTANVVDASLRVGVKYLSFISSIAALGKPVNILKSNNDILNINETQTWIDSDLNSHYAKSKYLAECEVWRGEAEGLKVSVLNPSIILGEGDWTRSSSQLFKYVYDKNKFYTKGFINFVDVKDIANACEQVLLQNKWGERYILSAGRVSYKSFFDEIAAAFELKSPSIELKQFWISVIWRIEFLKSLIFSTKPLITKETSQTAQTNILYENSKVKNELGINFTSFKESVKRVADWHLKRIVNKNLD